MQIGSIIEEDGKIKIRWTDDRVPRTILPKLAAEMALATSGLYRLMTGDAGNIEFEGEPVQ